MRPTALQGCTGKGPGTVTLQQAWGVQRGLSGVGWGPRWTGPHPGPEKVPKYCQQLALGWEVTCSRLQTFPEKSSLHRPALDPTCLLLAGGPLLQGQRTPRTGVGKPTSQAENLP